MFVGSCCEYFYEVHNLLSKDYSFFAMTQDIDLCIRHVWAAQKPTPFPEIMDALGYRKEVDYITGTAKYLSSNTEIEFLTPRKGDGSNPYPVVKSSGLKATELKHMDILAKNAIKVSVNNTNVYIPHPAAFALHKMVYHENREGNTKRFKDRSAIQRVINALLDTQEDTIVQVYNTLSEKQKKLVLGFLEKYNGKLYGINTSQRQPLTLDFEDLELKADKELEQNIWYER